MMKKKYYVLFFIMVAICITGINEIKPPDQIPIQSQGRLHLGSLAYIQKIKSIAQQHGSQQALDSIMKDVNRYGKDLDTNSLDNNTRFYTLVCQIVYKIGYVDMKSHYFRNKINRAPKTLKELFAINKSYPKDKRWRLLSVHNSKYHMQGNTGEYNLKFVSYDGFCEAVYNQKGRLLDETNDPVNMGTFNYAPGIPVLSAHMNYDINPYFKWGNAENSPQKGDKTIKNEVKKAFRNFKEKEQTISLYREKIKRYL